MDILLAVLGFLALLLGLAGAVLPLPGPPLSFVGILILHYSKYIEFSDNVLFTYGILTVVITILDYYVPIWGTKKFGGSKMGTYGSALGLLIGLFLGPFGLFIGAFLGAFLGEYFSNQNHNKAFKAAAGSFLGLMAGIFAKTVLCLAMLIHSVIAIIKYF